jgi:hypothetical protein
MDKVYSTEDLDKVEYIVEYVEKGLIIKAVLNGKIIDTKKLKINKNFKLCLN